MDFNEIHFWSISNFIFTACEACKIPVEKRPKMKLVEFHFLKSKIKCRSTGEIKE
jgi:hypothetical protein